QPAVAEIGALGALRPARQLAIKEDGDAKATDLLGDLDREGAGGFAVGGVDPDDRADVERSDRRVQAGVAGHVEDLDRLLGAGDESVAQARGPGREREDG